MSREDVVAELRQGVGGKSLDLLAALALAESQAEKLLKAHNLTMPPVPEGIVSELPFMEVRRVTPSLVAGAAHFSRGRWLIVINGADTPGRQRFTLMHEFKHVIDDPYPDLYRQSFGLSAGEIAERACDVFSASVLMPQAWVQEACAQRGSDLRGLAARFNVSLQAMQYRITSLGLIKKPVRCWASYYERRRYRNSTFK